MYKKIAQLTICLSSVCEYLCNMWLLVCLGFKIIKADYNQEQTEREIGSRQLCVLDVGAQARRAPTPSVEGHGLAHIPESL